MIPLRSVDSTIVYWTSQGQVTHNSSARLRALLRTKTRPIIIIIIIIRRKNAPSKARTCDFRITALSSFIRPYETCTLPTELLKLDEDVSVGVYTYYNFESAEPFFRRSS